jgi:hypothetical protein
MDSKKIGSDSEGMNEKKAYEPPKAMRLGDMRGGVGDCYESGSGDAWCDTSGNTATSGCYGSGNNGPY